MLTLTLLTETQIDTLWREAGHQRMMFLAELCERWLDADELCRPSYDATIQSYIKGSKLAAAVGL